MHTFSGNLRATSKFYNCDDMTKRPHCGPTYISGVTAHKHSLQRDLVPGICVRLDYAYLEINAAVHMIPFFWEMTLLRSVIGSRRFEAKQ